MCFGNAVHFLYFRVVTQRSHILTRTVSLYNKIIEVGALRRFVGCNRIEWVDRTSSFRFLVKVGCLTRRTERVDRISSFRVLVNVGRLTKRIECLMNCRM